ncbi:MAG: hypothetical protein ACRKGH_06270 [Dehalogenimonas sp.]
MKIKKAVVVPGRKAPGFELIALDGGTVRLSERLGRGRQTVLVFLRYLG